ncbi:MAG: DNA polymerase III subunit gamma/tau [Microthrixaceae bacterium]|nr:DNA polymerase III subunit gamma/tau [Microthrixaceae bacterium]
MAYQSLYRRYRPSRFSQVRGQSHVIPALLNAVRNDSVTHAYLFSGPRGTGKTSTARILAKALNCENSQDGEPCGECQSCKDMEAGQSFDLFELDAASNNGVDAIRDLTERAAVGSPGRTKVYILDEVHMLSPAASNALLKTLEEPPSHVRFVLATTDPQKVLPTIKSRTQHFEFQLLSAEELEEYVRWIAQDAPLDIDDESIRWAVRQGRGSARDTLSALDQVVAAGGVVERTEPVEQLLEALADKSPGTAILAVADSLSQGHDPRVLGRALLDTLRDLFLVSLGAPVPHLVPDDVAHLESWASRLGTSALTRAMETVGSALVEMRQAADPRVPLEVALVRLSSPGSDSVAELVERIERLEAALANGVPAAEGSRPAAASSSSGGAGRAPDDAPAGASEDKGLSGPARARAELARQRAKKEQEASTGQRPGASERSAASARQSTAPTGPTRSAPPTVPSSTPPVVPAASTPAEPAAQVPDPSPAPVASEPVAPPANEPAPVDAPSGNASISVESLNSAMTDFVLTQMKGVARALFSQGTFGSVEGSSGVFVVENAPTRDRAEKSREMVESLLSTHFGQPIGIRIVDRSQATTAGGQAASSRGSAPAGRASPSQEPPPTDDRGPASHRPPRTPESRAAEPPTVPSRSPRQPETEPDNSVPEPPKPVATPSPPHLGNGSGNGNNNSNGTVAPKPPASARRGAPTESTEAAKPTETDTPAESPEDEYMAIDLDELEDATGVAQTGLERLLEAFPGSTVIEPDAEAR